MKYLAFCIKFIPLHHWNIVIFGILRAWKFPTQTGRKIFDLNIRRWLKLTFIYNGIGKMHAHVKPFIHIYQIIYCILVTDFIVNMYTFFHFDAFLFNFNHFLPFLLLLLFGIVIIIVTGFVFIRMKSTFQTHYFIDGK